MLEINKQKMFYSLQGEEKPVYEKDSNGNVVYQSYMDNEGNVIYYLDDNGEKIPIETGEYKKEYIPPVLFYASISNKLSEALIKEFGVDDSTLYVQIVSDKGVLPLEVGSLVWKKSDVIFEDEDKTILNESSADYIVKGVAEEGLTVDLFLLQKIIK